MKNQHFRHFALGATPQITVKKTNGQSACNTSDRSDHTRTYEVRMAKAILIFNAWILRNPFCGSARP